MASDAGQPRTRHVCVDSAAEGVGTAGSEDGGLLYFQEFLSLPWTTYTSYLEAACVTCSVTAGAVYTRWGSSTCPGTSTLVHTGFMSASHYTQGASSTYLCLPMTPSYLTTQAGDQGGGNLYKVEYEFSGYGVVRIQGVHDRDALCAVCTATGRRTAIMVPARVTCPDGWARDYFGYLVSQLYTQSRSSSICVDYNPEYRADSAGSEDGGLLYPIEMQTFPNGFNYTVNREVMCAQCSNDAGPTYVRWGVRACPAPDFVVYMGWAGGSHYTQGGSTTRLCMPDSQENVPGIGQYDDANQGGGYIYRGEYQTNSNAVPSLVWLHDEEVPCSVCQTRAPSVFVQIGSQSCPFGAFSVGSERRRLASVCE